MFFYRMNILNIIIFKIIYKTIKIIFFKVDFKIVSISSVSIKSLYVSSACKLNTPVKSINYLK